MKFGDVRNILVSLIEKVYMGIRKYYVYKKLVSLYENCACYKKIILLIRKHYFYYEKILSIRKKTIPLWKQTHFL